MSYFYLITYRLKLNEYLPFNKLCSIIYSEILVLSNFENTLKTIFKMHNYVKLYLRAISRVLPTFLMAPFDAQKRQRINEIYALYQPKHIDVEFPIDPYIIPKTDILEIIGDDKCIYDGVYECGFGHITEFELKTICQIVNKVKPKTIFEIGTFEGRTTLNMALNAPEANIYTLDLPVSGLEAVESKVEVGEIAYINKDVSGSRFIGKSVAQQIHQLLGDSATFDFSPFYDSIDLMFIDGSHAHDYVLNDTEKALKLIKKGGIILWHDYTNWDGVRDAINGLYKDDSRFVTLKHIGGTSILMMQV
jgi:predicted O-methyltransferase YrrM